MRKLLIILISILFAVPAFAADLDDLDLPNARQPVENITVGGQPSIADLEKLKASGVTTIINLRTPGEFDKFDEGAEAEKLGLTYINIPVYGMKSVNRENADLLHTALEGAEGKVFVHCTVGMRAGTLLALEAYLHRDLTEEEAKDLGNRAHMDHTGDNVEKAIENLDDGQ